MPAADRGSRRGRRRAGPGGMRRAGRLRELLVSGVVDSFGMALGWTVVVLVATARGGLVEAALYNAAMLGGVVLSAPVTGWLARRLTGRTLLRGAAGVEFLLRFGVLYGLVTGLPSGVIAAGIAVMHVAAWAGFAGMRAEVTAVDASPRSMTRYAVSIAGVEATGTALAALLPKGPAGYPTGWLLTAVFIVYAGSLLPTVLTARRARISPLLSRAYALARPALPPAALAASLPAPVPTSPAVTRPTSPAVTRPTSPAVTGPASPALAGLTSPAMAGPASPALAGLTSPAAARRDDSGRQAAGIGWHLLGGRRAAGLPGVRRATRPAGARRATRPAGGRPSVRLLAAGGGVMLLAAGPTLLAVPVTQQLHGSGWVAGAAVAFSLGTLLSTRAVEALGRHRLPAVLRWSVWGLGMLVGWVFAPAYAPMVLVAQFAAGLSQTAFEGDMDARVAEQAAPGSVTRDLAYSASVRALGGSLAVRALPMLVAAPAIGMVASAASLALGITALTLWAAFAAVPQLFRRLAH